MWGGGNRSKQKAQEGSAGKYSQKYFLPHPLNTETYRTDLFPSLFLPHHDLLSLLCVSPGLSRPPGTHWDNDGGNMLPYYPPLSSYVTDYGQPRLVTQPHTGLLSIIWLISIVYNALLPTTAVNGRMVSCSLSGVNLRQDREHLNALRPTDWAATQEVQLRWVKALLTCFSLYIRGRKRQRLFTVTNKWQETN